MRKINNTVIRYDASKRHVPLDGTGLALINPLPRVSSAITEKFLGILDEGYK